MRTCLLCFILASSLQVAIGQKPISDHNIKVCGRVIPSKNTSRVISLTYSQFSVSPTRLTSILDSTGLFHFEFQLLNSQNVLLKFEQGIAELFVKPQDSLFLTINPSEFKTEKYPAFGISGTDVETTQNILAFRRHFQIPAFVPAPAGKTAGAYLKELSKQIDLEDSLLNEFKKSSKTTEDFKRWAPKDIRYRNANFLVDFEAHHAMQGKPFTGILYDTLLFPVNDNDALNTSWYNYHLWQYALSKYAKMDPRIQDLFKQQLWGKAYIAVLNKVIMNEPAGMSRDVIAYQLLSAIFERDIAELQTLSENLDTYIENRPLIAMLADRKIQSKSGRPFAISQYQNSSKAEMEILGDFMTELISRNKDKVIYIDVWATWCGPCRAEVPHAIDLETKFGDEPVVFVNLCLASEREAWKRAIIQQKIPGKNYFFDKDQSALLTKKLKIDGFPSYIIIDKNGQIVTTQAPRPSSGEKIQTLLADLLK